MSNSVEDWVRLVEADKSELGITLTEQEIQGVSKNTFNNFVKKKAKTNMLKYLSEQKMKHSKAKHLNCAQFKQADYIQDSRYKRKTTSLQNQKQNNRCKGDKRCNSCGLFRETQSHLRHCPELVSSLKYLNVKSSTLNENFV